jgi:hypothetical protein
VSEIDRGREPPEDRATRAAVLFDEQRLRIFKQTDRLFAVLMVVQWVGGIIAALCLSPKTWAGAESSINIHVWAAIFIGGAIASLPIALIVLYPGRTVTRHVIATCEMLFSALLIDVTGGRIETHFHIFGALALLAFYRDWRVLITASAVTAVHHGLFGVLAPVDIYGVLYNPALALGRTRGMGGLRGCLPYHLDRPEPQGDGGACRAPSRLGDRQRERRAKGFATYGRTRTEP